MGHWDDISLVMEIVRQGGMNPAAKALKISHSTLSRRIARLEERTGVRLFDRLGRGLAPTRAGREMAEAGERMEVQVLAMNLSLAGRDKSLGGSLKVTAPSLLIKSYLAPILMDFARAHPEIELRINASHEALNLYRREADVAIRATNDPPENLFGRRVARQRRAVYAARSYFSVRHGVTPASIEGLDWLGFDWWDDEETKKLHGGRIIARFDDMVALLGALDAGMGVARLPCHLGDSDRQLVRLTGFEPDPYYDFWLLTHPGLKHVVRVRSFMAFVARRFERDQQLFLGSSKAD